MDEQKKLLSLLQVTVPPSTTLTAASAMKILEILGIVSNPNSVSALHLAADIVPPNTVATTNSMGHLLLRLAKAHPDCPKDAHSKLDELLQGLEKNPDSPLTYGAFLSLCDSWIRDAAHKGDHHHKGGKRAA